MLGIDMECRYRGQIMTRAGKLYWLVQSTHRRRNLKLLVPVGDERLVTYLTGQRQGKRFPDPSALGHTPDWMLIIVFED
jgi:hypothetical protein